MIACISLTCLFPIAISVLLDQFNHQIVLRARATPFVVGARGSKLDLALHTIYFEGRSPEQIPYGSMELVTSSGSAAALPIHSKYTAHGKRVIGTTLDYFEFRGLVIDRGDSLVRIGDCVVGANVARDLKLKPGDQILTHSDNIVDIAGSYPVKLTVTGIFSPADSPDDQVIFVDIKTTWVIDGHGHGHADVRHVGDEKLLGIDGNKRIASAAVQPYIEFDEESLRDLHFHGVMQDFPVSAIIVIPRDERSATLLLSQLNRSESMIQMTEPLLEVQQLMAIVFQIKRLFNANALLMGISTLLLLFLVVMLSLRLREGERQTMHKLGCGRRTVWLTQVTELVLVFIFASICISIMTILLVLVPPDFLKWFTVAS